MQKDFDAMKISLPHRFYASLKISFIVGAVFASSTAMAAQNNPISGKDLARKECGECHFYYAREYLPAYSWKKIVENLDNHFGEDASLDPETSQRILAYLVQNRSTEIPMRVTQTPWWKRAHGSSWQALGAQSKINVSDCGKCHRQ